MDFREVLLYLGSIRNYKLPRRELEELQAKKLRAVITYLHQSVPFYSRVFRESGLDPGVVRKVQDIRGLPFTTKADLLEAQGSARPSGGKGSGRIITSSGTTGRPVALARSHQREVVNRALSIRTMMQVGLMPWSRVATLWAPRRYWKKEVLEDGTSRPYTTIDSYPVRFLGRNLPNILTLQVDPGDPVRDWLAMKRFEPDYIYSRPSYLRRIARSCGPALGIEPRAILATGEVVTATGLGEMRKAYGAKVIRSYGDSDVGKLGADCAYETGLHTWEDFMVYEILKDGEEVSEGEVGELVVTTLYRDRLPRLRFRTGDYVKRGANDRCECGSSTTRLESVEGREGDFLVGRGGERFMPTEVADHLESAFGLRDFQLVQRGLDDFVLLLRAGEVERFAEAGGVGGYLEELIGSAVRLEVGRRSDEEYWTKTRPVVSRV